MSTFASSRSSIFATTAASGIRDRRRPAPGGRVRRRASGCVEQILERARELVVVAIVQRPVGAKRLPFEHAAVAVHQRRQPVVPCLQQHQAQALEPRRHRPAARRSPAAPRARIVDETEVPDVGMLRHRHVRRDRPSRAAPAPSCSALKRMKCCSRSSQPLFGSMRPRYSTNGLRDARAIAVDRRSGRAGSRPEPMTPTAAARRRMRRSTSACSSGVRKMKPAGSVKKLVEDRPCESADLLRRSAREWRGRRQAAGRSTPRHSETPRTARRS